MTLHLLILSGTVGVGKTTLGGEIHDVLSEREIPNAFFDLDALRYQWPETSPWNAELVAEHLHAMWPNLDRRGVSHLVIAGVMETPSDVGLISAPSRRTTSPSFARPRPRRSGSNDSATGRRRAARSTGTSRGRSSWKRSWTQAPSR